MSRKTDTGAIVTGEVMNRRRLFGLAANVAATVVVTQAGLSCTSDVAGAEADGAGGGACVLTAALTEGPYFVDEKLLRSDIRTDPATGAVSPGVQLDLTFNVNRVAGGGCTPLSGGYLDVWHADAAGVYSDVGSASGRRFLRGYQLTDVNGQAKFTTVYPGWYQGRAVHIHFKLRLFTGSTQTASFTSQFFFNESLTDTVYAQTPYASRGSRDTRNTNDGIYNSLSATEKSALTLAATANGSVYEGVINLGVQIG